MNPLKLLAFLCPLAVGLATSQSPGDDTAKRLSDKGLRELGAYSLLRELTTNVGARLSGSPQADKAVAWGLATMKRRRFDDPHLMPCKVPRWVRGKEEVRLLTSRGGKLACYALGGSVGTPRGGIEGEVIEVRSLEEAARQGAKGKIVFFNRPMDPTLLNTFGAYGGAVDQRFGGAVAAAKAGAIAVLVRSMTHESDDEPHTGAMGYEDGVAKIPAAAVSIKAANSLSGLLKLARGPIKVRLELGCRTLPDAPSANVVGEVRGSEHPEEVIVMGGHLDSWDKGQGAHDDGAGVCQSLEALRLIKQLGLKPKRTIRVVLFMNEENGSRGADAYAAYAKTAMEKHIAGIESDSGGFAPRGFTTSLDAQKARALDKWLPALASFEADRFFAGGGGGADVGPLEKQGAVLFGLEPESQRYFGYHHSNKDTLDKVNPRELELGALAMATLAWRISEEGLP